MKRLHPREFKTLSKKINLKEAEVKDWRRIIPRVTLHVKKNGLIEQFDGYLKKKEIKIKDLKKDPIPPLPKNIKLKDIGKTQLVKQADVVMLLYLLSDNFDKNVKKKNFYYYLRRTLHKSSLSAFVHAALAAEIGDIKLAYRYFNIAVNMDLTLLYGNTDDGIHAASLGGVWQAAISGLAGTRIINGTLSISPHLPKEWKEISFCIKWHGYSVRIIVGNEVTVKFHSRRNKDRLKIDVYGTLHRIEANKSHTFIKKR